MGSHHSSYLNQNHNFTSGGLATNDEEILNLNGMYPQTQSPMSFKQIQNAKRLKKVSGNFVNQPSRQSNNSTNQPNKSPMAQFYG